MRERRGEKERERERVHRLLLIGKIRQSINIHTRGNIKQKHNNYAVALIGGNLTYIAPTYIKKRSYCTRTDSVCWCGLNLCEKIYLFQNEIQSPYNISTHISHFSTFHNTLVQIRALCTPIIFRNSQFNSCAGVQLCNPISLTRHYIPSLPPCTDTTMVVSPIPRTHISTIVYSSDCFLI